MFEDTEEDDEDLTVEEQFDRLKAGISELREVERMRVIENIKEQSDDFDLFGEQVALDVAAADYGDSDLDAVTPKDAAVDSEPTLFVTEENHEKFEQGLLDRDDLGAREEDTITTIPQYHSIITNLFTPRSRAVVIDTWLREGTEPMTASEIAANSDKLTRQTVHEHLDALEKTYGIIVEDGKKGNATAYRLNYRNPFVQCIQMLAHLGRFGRTNLLLERDFLTPGPNGESLSEIETEYIDRDEPSSEIE